MLMMVYNLSIIHFSNKKTVACYHLLVNLISSCKSYFLVNSPKGLPAVIFFFPPFFLVADRNALESSLKISCCADGHCHDLCLIEDYVVREKTRKH